MDQIQMGRIEFSLEVPLNVAAEGAAAENPAVAPPAPTRVPANLPTPSVLRSSHRDVDVFQLNTNDPHYMKIIQEIRHPYIIRPEGIIYGHVGGVHTILVKPYLGNLKDYFQEISSNQLNSPEYILSCVQLVFSQAISAVIYLMDHGLHHANFSLQTTYYRKDDKKPVVQLANFKEWTSTEFESVKLLEDWISVGVGLEAAVDIIKKFRQKIDERCFCEIKDLSIMLKDRGIPVEKKKKTASEHFFWGPAERAAFFTHKIPRLLSDNAFYLKVWSSLITPTDFHWGEETSFEGLLKVMNDHRRNFLGIEKFNAVKKAHYLNFVCGSYTHERQLQAQGSLRLTVDEILRKCDPEFVLNVVKVLRAYETEKQRIGQP